MRAPRRNPALDASLSLWVIIKNQTPGQRCTYLVFVLFFGIILLAGCGGSAGTPRSSGTTTTSSGSSASVQHVVIVVEENHSYGSVIGNSSMPYLNGLASQYALAT